LVCKKSSLGFLSFSQAVTPLSERRNYREEWAEATPPPHVPLTSDSSSLLDVPRSGAPRPFFSSLASSILVFVWYFAVLLFCLFLCFFEFFCSFCRSSPRQFRCPLSIVELLSRLHCDELPLNVHAIGFFSCISFCLYSVMLLLFSLYFIVICL
jgi:hypothetical protein